MNFKNNKLCTTVAFLFTLILTSFAFGVSAEVLFHEDFENLTVGETPSTIGGVSQSLGEYEKVVYDEQNNTKALKLGKGTSEGGKNEVIKLDKEYKDGIFVFSYKVRPKNDSAWASHFMRLTDSNGKNGTYDQFIGVNFWLGHVADGEAPGYNIGPSSADDGTYIDVKLVVDFNNGIYREYVTKNGNTVNTDFNLRISNVSGFYTLYQQSNPHGGSGDMSKDAEYWVDEIKVERFPVLVVNKMENTLISDVTSSVNIEFDNELSGVSADTVEIYCNGSTTKLPTSDYTVSYTNKKITIAFNSGMNESSDYEVKLGKGIKAVNSEYDPMIGSTVATFRTPDVFDGVMNVENNGKYNEPYILNITTTNTYDITLKRDGTPITFSNGMSLEHGVYTMDIKMWLALASSRAYTKTITFEVFSATAPIFETLEIVGKPIIGENLSINYKYVDYNNDPEDKNAHEFYWFRSSNGIDYEKLDNDNKMTYTLGNDDVNCYFKLEAYPHSTVEPKKGEKHESEVFKGPFKPVVKGDVTLNVDGISMKVVYNYFDENGCDENGTTFQWYRMTEPTATPVAISGATTDSYTFTDDDADCYVYCAVTPKKAQAPFEGNVYKSNTISCPKKPIAKNVKITGTSMVGNSLAVSFTYYDEENDPEGKHIIQWYVAGTEYSNEEAVVLTTQMAGQSVWCVVTPVSKNFPYKGTPVTTEIKTVNYATASTGGSSAGSSIGAGSYKKDNTTVTPTTPVIPSEPTKEEFSDMKNHWARDNVKRAVELGFVKGKSEYEFSPDSNITRAEFAVIMVRVLNLNIKKSNMVDILEDSWYNEYVGAIIEAGYMSGYDGYFRPNENITREEMCKVIDNILENITEINDADFSDYEEISDWAKQSVSKAYKFGIVNGREDGSFSPKDNSTRAEATSVVLRLYDYMMEVNK